MVRWVPGTDINMEVRTLPSSVYHQIEKKKYRKFRDKRKVLVFLVFTNQEKTFSHNTILVKVTTKFDLCFRLCFHFPKDNIWSTACLSVTPAYGTDQDHKGCSQRSRTKRTEILFQVSLLEYVQKKTDKMLVCFRCECFKEKKFDHTVKPFESVSLWFIECHSQNLNDQIS